MKKEIYFDNAATSWPKPEDTGKAMMNFMDNIGANPGRSGHSKSLDSARIIFEARETIAEFFNTGNSEFVTFSKNATESLNIALKGLLKPGDNVVTTSMEHNSVMRPLRSLEQSIGITVSVVNCDERGCLPVENFEKTISENTRLVVATHASNVTGTIMPVKEIGELCREKGVLFLLDSAQTAGVVPLNMIDNKIDILAFTGHKGLLGPTGTGGLCFTEDIGIEPLMQGGSGSRSEMEYHPEMLPDRLESGTINGVGIAGLKAGIDFIKRIGISTIDEHEKKLLAVFLAGLAEIPEITLYGPDSSYGRTAVISFSVKNIPPNEIAYSLDKNFGILSRVGLQCSPAAHRTIGTFPDGTVRFSFNYFNTVEEVEFSLKALSEIVKNK